MLWYGRAGATQAILQVQSLEGEHHMALTSVFELGSDHVTVELPMPKRMWQSLAAPISNSQQEERSSHGKSAGTDGSIDDQGIMRQVPFRRKHRVDGVGLSS